MISRNVWLMALLMVIVGSVYADSANTSLIDLKKTLPISEADKASMANNAYVYMMAIDAADDNYYKVGKRIILKDDATLQKILFTKQVKAINAPYSYPDYKTVDPVMLNQLSSYVYPCEDLDSLSCLDDAIKSISLANNLILENKVMLTRYEAILKLPIFKSYTTHHATLLPRYQYIIKLSELRQIQAIKLMNQGESTKAFVVLQQEINFYKQMLTSDANLLDAMIAIRILYTLYHTVEQLMDNPALIKGQSKLMFKALLKPLTNNEQKAIGKILKKEAASLLLLEREEIENEMAHNNQFLKAMNYAPNKTIFTLLDYTKSFEVALPESTHFYQQLKTFISKQYTTNEIEQLRLSDNGLGELFIVMQTEQLSEYVFRFYDLVNYITLLNTKLAIKQSGITKTEVPIYLKQMADKAINPYSK